MLHKGDAFYKDHCNMNLAAFDHGSVRLLINKTRAEVGPGQFKLDPFLLKSGVLLKPMVRRSKFETTSRLHTINKCS